MADVVIKGCDGRGVVGGRTGSVIIKLCADLSKVAVANSSLTEYERFNYYKEIVINKIRLL